MTATRVLGTLVVRREMTAASAAAAAAKISAVSGIVRTDTTWGSVHSTAAAAAGWPMRTSMRVSGSIALQRDGRPSVMPASRKTTNASASGSPCSSGTEIPTIALAAHAAQVFVQGSERRLRIFEAGVRTSAGAATSQARGRSRTSGCMKAVRG